MYKYFIRNKNIQMIKIEAIGNKNGEAEKVYINFKNYKWIKIIDKEENEEKKKLIKLGVTTPINYSDDENSSKSMSTNFTISEKEWENLESTLNKDLNLLRVETVRDDLYFISLDANGWVKVKETRDGDMILNFTKTTTVTVEKDFYTKSIEPKLISYTS